MRARKIGHRREPRLGRDDRSMWKGGRTSQCGAREDHAAAIGP